MPSLMDTHIENRHRIQPGHANNYESAHGGYVMKVMDEVGAMSAMRFAGTICVTAAVDQLDFRRPIPVGDIAVVESYVFAHGTTSVRVRIRASREDPRTGEVEPTTESCFTFVALDEDGAPTEVPELEVETDRGRRLREEAIDEDGGD